MKSNHSFSFHRRALIASAMAVLLGAATAVAQSGTAGSTSSGTTGTTGSDTSRRTQSNAPTTPGGTYDSGSTTGSATTDRSTDPTAAPSGTYGPGTTSTTTSATGRSPAGSDKLSWGDRRFVNKAVDAGQAEVQMAQLAAERATNTEVRSFAQKLIDHHTKVNSELKSLAGTKNLSLDTDDDKDRAYRRLNKKSGSEFDEEFVEHMIDEHEKDIKTFEKAASDAKDPELRSFASKHVGALREHLETAQSLRQTLMPTGRTDDRSGRSTPGGTPGSAYDTSSTGSSTGTSSGTTGSSDTSSSSRDTSTTTPPN